MTDQPTSASTSGERPQYEYQWVRGWDADYLYTTTLNEKAEEGWRVVPGMSIRGSVLMERRTHNNGGPT